MSNEDQLILVDERDVQTGTRGKLEVHTQGLLHRAFSIIVKNNKGEIMLQKRALSKYHSGGLWTNTCCGHPRDGEELETAAHRRLSEEMGFDCPLKEITSFIYQVNLDHGLQEHEFLHVYLGEYSTEPVLNPDEADDWKWISLQDMQSDISNNPENYTYWFKTALKKIGEKHIAL